MTCEAPAPEQFACTLVDLARDCHAPDPFQSARDAVAGSARLDREEGIDTAEREEYYAKVLDEIDRIAPLANLDTAERTAEMRSMSDYR